MKNIIRKAKNSSNPYAQILRTALQDKDLTWKERGMLAYLLSLPDNWRLYLSELSTRSEGDGIDSTRSTLNGLIYKGYVHRRKLRNQFGQFGGYEYLIFEEPHKTITDADYDPAISQMTKEQLDEAFWQTDKAMAERDIKEAQH